MVTFSVFTPEASGMIDIADSVTTAVYAPGAVNILLLEKEKWK